MAGIITAALLVSMTVSAQTNSRAASDRQASQSKAQAETTQTMTLVGCLIKEADYRRAHGLGKGGVAGFRPGSDFVLVNASESAAPPTTTEANVPSSTGTAASRTTAANCIETGGGTAYRLAGKREGELKRFVGHRVEITGRFEHADDAKIAEGEKSARLPAEIVVSSFREARAATGEAPTASSAASAPEPSSTVARSETTSNPLPKTASNEPLMALIGLLSLTAGIGLSVWRRRES